MLSIWGARPTGTSIFAKTDLFLLYYVSSYVQNRFESRLLINFRVDACPGISQKISYFQKILLFRQHDLPRKYISIK